jgi:hypothetical protein
VRLHAQLLLPLLAPNLHALLKQYADIHTEGLPPPTTTSKKKNLHKLQKRILAARALALQTSFLPLAGSPPL